MSKGVTPSRQLLTESLCVVFSLQPPWPAEASFTRNQSLANLQSTYSPGSWARCSRAGIRTIRPGQSTTLRSCRCMSDCSRCPNYPEGTDCRSVRLRRSKTKRTKISIYNVVPVCRAVTFPQTGRVCKLNIQRGNSELYVAQ